MNWANILLIMIIILIGCHLLKSMSIKSHSEGFDQKQPFVMKNDNDIYDAFYVTIYDELYDTQKRTNEEFKKIVESTGLNDSSVILDIGAGTGELLQKISEKGIQCHGIDQSQSMINCAKGKYPQLNMSQGDVMDPLSFTKSMFSHICVMNFTLYHFQDKKRFLRNCRDWLQPNGYLIMHIVNKNKYDATVPAANPLYDSTPQKYSDKRLKNTTIDFINFTYDNKVDFKRDDRVIVRETFTDKNTSKVRMNELTLYMEQEDDVIKKCKDMGFIVKGKFVSYKDKEQFIYIFEKQH